MPCLLMCRLCLATDTRLAAIANTSFQDIYEKLTNVALNSMEKPTVACYLCVAQLRKCQKFTERAIQADELLTRMLQARTEINTTPVNREAYKLSANLTMSPTESYSSDCCQPVLEVKKEIPCELEDITYHEEEMQSNREDIPTVENSYLNEMENGIVIEKKYTVSEKYYKEKTELSEKENITCFFIKEESNPQETEQHEKETTANENIVDCKQGKPLNDNTDEDSQQDSIQSYICNDCGEKFNNKSVLADHIANHDTIKSKMYFNCDFCPYQGNTRDSLEKHDLIHNNRTSTQEGYSESAIVPYKNSTKIDVDSLFSIHSGEKPYKCKVCEYRSRHKGSMKAHLRVHTGEKPFACTICEYRSNQKGALKLHFRTHTGEKPFACTVCEYRCNQKGLLTKHLRIHTGEKPFACTICAYRCSKRESLRRHLRIHTGEKPYKCTLCDYRCNGQDYIKKHLRTHTGERPYKCTVCDYKSKDTTTLKRHLLRAHKA